MNSTIGVTESTDSDAAKILQLTFVPVEPVSKLSSCLPMDEFIERELDALVPHSLDSLKNAVLMNRVDSKFLVPVSLARDLLANMSEEYSVLEINDLRSFNYQTSYYDTPQHVHYLAHHNGRLDRFKIRKRTYVESGASYLEVKLKDNRGRTTKTRMSCDVQRFELGDEALGFLTRCGVPEPGNLELVQTVAYRRVALANEARGERLTIDFNLTFEDERSSCCCALGPWVIVELKQDRLNRDSSYFSWARRHGIRELSFSKYCMGVYFTGAQSVKRNNFHPIARRLRH